MKTSSWLGILLVVVGVLLLAYQGIDYTRQKKVAESDRFMSPKKPMSGFRFLRYWEGSPWSVGLSYS